MPPSARLVRPALVALALLIAPGRASRAEDAPPPRPAKPDPRLAERDRLWGAAQRAAGAGDPATALKEAGAMLAVERAVFGPSHRELVPSLEFVARQHRAAGDWGAAAATTREVSALRTRLDGADSWRVTDARLLAKRDGLVGAMAAADRAGVGRAEELLAKAVALAGEGKFAEALVEAEGARERRLALFGEASVDHAASLNYVGYLRSLLKDHPAAEADHRRALAAREALLGPGHPDVALSLVNVGVARFKQGDPAGAAALLVRAAAVRERALGEGHPDTAETLVQLAAAYREAGEYKPAMAALSRAAESTAKRAGESDPALARITNQAGLLSYRQKDYDNAERAFAEAHGIWAKSKGFGPSHADTRTAAANLVAVHEAQLAELKGDGPDALRAALPLRVKLARRLAAAGEAAKSRAEAGTIRALRAKLGATPAPTAVRPVAQVGHTFPTGAVAFSPDGRFVASADDNAVVVWDAESGREVRRLLTGANALAFSPDGRLLAVNDYSRAVLWDIGAGRKLFSFDGHDGPVNSVAFSPDGTALATAGADKTARLWDAVTGQELLRLRGHTDAVRVAEFSRDGNRVVTASTDRTARIWDVTTGEATATLAGHEAGVLTAAFSPSGARVVTGGGDGTVRVWDAVTGKQTVKEAFPGDGFEKMVTTAWSANGAWIAAAYGNAIRLIPTGEGEARDAAKFGSTGEPQVVAISPDGKRMAACNASSIRVWDTATGAGLPDLAGLSADTRAVAFSPKGDSILTAGDDRTARVWEPRGPGVRRVPSGRFVEAVRDGKRLEVWTGAGGFTGHTGPVQAVAYSPDGKCFVTGGWSKRYDLSGKTPAEVVIWDAATSQPLRRIEVGGNVLAAAFAPDGKSIAAGLHLNTGAQSLKIWDAVTGRELPAPPCDLWQIDWIAFAPDGKSLLATGFSETRPDGHSAQTRVWSLPGGKELKRWGGYSPGAAFTPDGKAVVGRYPGEGRDVAAETRAIEGDQVLASFETPLDVTALAVSAAGRRVAALGQSGGAVWDAAGKLVCRIDVPFGSTITIVKAAFAPDGRRLAVVAGQTTHLIDAVTGKELCRLVGFTDDTWAVADPQGRYDASDGGDVAGLHWVVGTEPIALSQLKERYYDPGLLAKHLGFSKEPLREVAAFTAPKMYPGVEATAAGAKLDVTLTNRGGGIGKVVVLVNGKEATADARPRGTDPDAASLKVRLDLTDDPRVEPGKKNKVEVVAYNAEGYLASRGLVREFEPGGEVATEPPVLWAVVAGVSDYRGDAIDLKFAAKDADDLAAGLRVAGGGLFGAKGVRLTALTTTTPEPAKQPTRANLVAALTAARRAKPADVLVVYLAGHGVNHGGPDGDFYYLTAEAATANLGDPAVRAATTLSSRELTELLKLIPAQKQVLILDTCASGKLVEKLSEKRDVPGSQVRALEQLKDRTGMYVLAGCAADSVSYEASRYGQGLLTYSLLLGMRGAALKDQRVDVAALFGFAADKVPELARDIGGVQRPVVAAPRGGQPFPIGLVTPADAPRIPLQSVRPLLLRCNLQEEDEFKDVLDLGRKVDDALRTATGRGRGATLVFVDAAELPDAHHLAGRYKVDGEAVAVTAILFRGKERVGRVAARGEKSKPDALAGELAAAIEAALAAAKK